MAGARGDAERAAPAPTRRRRGVCMLSCLTLACAVDGRDVVTIEGLARDGRLDPLQDAFLNHAALQCGFCTPGMTMMGRALLNENGQPSEADVREFGRGCLCRCTGYASIVRAVLAAAGSEADVAEPVDDPAGGPL